MDLDQFPNHFNQLLSWVILQPHPWRPTTGDGCRPADGPPPRLRGLAGRSPGAQRRAAAAGDGGRQWRLCAAATGRDGQRGKGRSGTKWDKVGRMGGVLVLWSSLFVWLFDVICVLLEAYWSCCSHFYLDTFILFSFFTPPQNTVTLRKNPNIEL